MSILSSTQSTILRIPSGLITFLLSKLFLLLRVEPSSASMSISESELLLMGNINDESPKPGKLASAPLASLINLVFSIDVKGLTLIATTMEDCLVSGTFMLVSIVYSWKENSSS
ncbi:hypothetical protein WN66_02170 [Saccharomyces cerevisiae]|nr:hypothetical protein WN66_02170 [Saccharomyces cerevisiae]